MSNHFLTARGTDLPFSHKSMISIAHEQNIICSKTLICRQLLFAGHVVGSRPMKRKDKIHQMIISILCLHSQKTVLKIGKSLCRHEMLKKREKSLDKDNS